jgi:sigma-B regulation protein RsbU (phosphoserine phosphatase)
MQLPSPISSRRHADPIEILLEAAEIVTEHSLALEELLPALAELVRKVVDYQLIAVFLRSGTDALRIRFSIGYREDFTRNLRLKIGEGITGLAALKRETIIVNDVTRDDRYLMAIDAVRSEIAVPLLARGKIAGVIDLQSTQVDAFGDYEKKMLELIGSRFSMAIDAARLYRATLRQNRTLRTLAEIAQEFSRILRLEDLLQNVSTSVRRLIPYDAFSILLREKDVLKHYFGVRFDERTHWESMPLSKGIVGAAATTGRPILARDTTRDTRYIAVIEGIRSEVAVPLMIKDQVIGVMDLESEEVGAFSHDHVRTLMLLAPQIATAIDNARLYEQVARSQEKLQRDLTAARQLQSQMLPTTYPHLKGLELFAHNDPAAEVTGDLYDFVPYAGGQLGILVGDVSGKGAAAALYAAMAIGMLRNLVQPGQSPAALLEAANTVLLERRVGTRYLTAMYAKWYPKERRLLIANAGQPRPILRRRDKIETLPVVGIPLGLLEGSSYEQLDLHLEPGDLLVFASDGITETDNEARVQYGEQHLSKVIAENRAASASELLKIVFDDVGKFAAGQPQADDRTLIVAKITG